MGIVVGGWGARNFIFFLRFLVERGGVFIWLFLFLGFINISRGFMRGDGVGLMMKGF